MCSGMLEEKLPKGKTLTCICLGFVCGVALFSYIQPLPPRESVFCCAVSLLVAMLAWRVRSKKLHIAVWFAGGLCFAMWRYALSFPLIDSSHVSYYNGQTVSIVGVISREPIDRGDAWQLTLNTSEMTRTVRQTKHEETKPIQGLVLITAPPLPAYGYGDRLQVSCMLKKPENKDFAYDRYLARYGIYSLCSRPHVQLEAAGQGNRVVALLLRIKHRSYELAQAYMPEPTASLALPVVFGGGQGIDDDITDSFRRTGLTHIMAVSGFNVSLLAALLGCCFIAIGVSRRSTFFATSIVIAAYVVMVGAPASAVRAGVMSIFLLLALTVGRLASLPRSVLVVAAMTLVVNPRLLRDDIGWQLSFLALLGLMYILPYLEKWSLLLTKGKYKAFITALMATVAAQIATAPVILYNFGNFSVIAPLANLLVVWIVPILTVAMMMALPLAALFPQLGSFFFFPCWLMVKYVFCIVDFLARLPWASLQIGE